MATYVTAWKPVTPELGLQAIADTSTTQQHPLGKVIKAVEITNSNGEGDFIYCKGVGSCAAGSWVTIPEDDYVVALLAANAIGRVGVSMAATTAALWGWFQISGKAVGKALTAFADNGNVYSTATAGSVDDAIVAGDRVQNCKGASALDAPVTGMAEFEIDHPFVNDALAD